MWLFVRHIFQLLLSPARGWEDVSSSGIQPEAAQRQGFYPLIALTALSEFVPMFYDSDYGFIHALECAVAMGFAMFASLFLGRLFLDMTLSRFVDGELNMKKVDLCVTFLMGLNCLFCILNNVVPAQMTVLKLLPLITVIVIFKSTAYLGIREDSQLNFTGLGIVAVIIIPLIITNLLLLFI